jgi:hypothetical protein
MALSMRDIMEGRLVGVVTRVDGLDALTAE